VITLKPQVFSRHFSLIYTFAAVFAAINLIAGVIIESAINKLGIEGIYVQQYLTITLLVQMTICLRFWMIYRRMMKKTITQIPSYNKKGGKKHQIF